MNHGGGKDLRAEREIECETGFVFSFSYCSRSRLIIVTKGNWFLLKSEGGDKMCIEKPSVL